MTDERRGRWRLLAWTSFLVGIVSAAALAVVWRWGSSSSTTQLALAGLSIVSAVSTVAANAVMVRAGHDPADAPTIEVTAVLPASVEEPKGEPDSRRPQLGEATFVDRDRELTGLATKLATAPVVACHGSQGTGKSYLLQYVVDVVNGHLPRRPHHAQDPPLPSASLYFDLADALGWDRVERQVCGDVIGTRTGASWSAFCHEVDRRFGADSVLLVLDNVNAPAIWPSVGRAVYAYLQRRGRDRVVLGSIEPVVVDNLALDRLEVPAFDIEAIVEYAAARGQELDTGAAFAVADATLGLPLFLDLAFSAPEEHGYRRGAAATTLERSLLVDLPAPDRRAMSYIALLALVERRIAASELARLPIIDLDDQLDRVARRSLVSITVEQGVRSVRVHDIVRDQALQVLEEAVKSAASVLVEWALHRENQVWACVFALHCDPATLGEDRLWTLVESVVRRAVKERNYALLESVHHRVSTSEPLTRSMWADAGRADLLSLARGSQLAGLGRYREAEEALFDSSVVRVRPGTLDLMNDLQVDLYYLLADVIHLQNRYGESAAMFRDLGNMAIAREDALLESRCLRAVGHVLRHQGRDLETALHAFEDAARAAKAANDLRAQLLAATGRIGIHVYTGTVTPEDAEELVMLDGALLESADYEGYRFNVWKYQAQVAWALGDRATGIRLVEAAIAEALRLNDRLLYNLYFERAEYSRLSTRIEDAVADYERALEAGEANGDRNLIANARLGLVACDLAAPGWPIFRSADAAHAEVLRARSVALEADIQATVAEATSLANSVASEDGDYRPRFVLF